VALLPGQWAQARAGGGVVVGSRAAAFAPLPVLGAAVVLDAHDEAYHEERSPTWCAWQVAVERARRQGAPCALVSPCPTLDVLEAGRLVAPSRHDERAGWPPVEVVDRGGDDPRSGLYSERLVGLVRWAAAEPGRRVLCVLNRTGRIRLLACAACGELTRCERCGAAVESKPDAGLWCRRCGAERPAVCGRCGATRLKAVRVGVSRVREELEALAGTPVAEVWGAPGGPGDTTGNRPGVPPAAAVVVGTEAVLHRASTADVVAFLDFDAELLAPRLRAAEEALALLARAARLVAGQPHDAARGRAGGRVVVQTRQPRHPALAAALAADPGLLASSEAPLRAELGLPPFTAVALVSGPAAGAYGAALSAGAGPAVEVSGPLEGTWRLRATGHGALCDLLERTPRPPGRLRVEVDPVRA
jgi:primosomal protein N' (replication factor Y)